MQKKSTLKILVLDNDPFTLKLLDRMLGTLGFISVTVCNKGNAALQQMNDATGTPELILLGLNMPKMGGAEFVRKLAKRHYTGSLILVRGKDRRVLQTAKKMVQKYRISLLGQLVKPVTLKMLATTLGNVDYAIATEFWNGKENLQCR